MRPLARSKEEFASVCREIDDFGRPDGLGPVLQQLLHQYKNVTDTWLKDGEDVFYLAFREPVSSPDISSYFFSLTSIP